MTATTTHADLDQFIGSYGQGWKVGLISEHVPAFLAAGGTVRQASRGGHWAVVDGRAYRVLCSELVQVETEDGPISGRCGQVALVEGSCEAHAEEREQWMALSEAERRFYEQQDCDDRLMGYAL